MVNGLESWNLLDADVISWHQAGDQSTRLIFGELVELLSMILPQAAQSARNRLSAEPDKLAELAITALQDHEASVERRIRAEYTLWWQVLTAGKSSIFVQFKGLTFEMLRLTYALADHHEAIDHLYTDLLRGIG